MNETRIKRALLILAALTLLLAPLSAPRAETRGGFLQDAYTGAYGREAVVTARAFFAHAATFTLETEDGRALGQQTMKESGKIMRFSFTVPADFPRCSTLRLLSDDSDQVLAETLFFADGYQNVGLKRVGCSKRKLALTFDSGADAALTRDILDLLDKYQVKATFFLIGLYAERNPEETALIAQRGHELASHSYEHPEMADLSAGEAYQSILKAERLLQGFNGGGRVLYRPPSGVSTFRDRAVARGMGSEVILWSVDSGDGFVDKTLHDVIFRVNRGLHNGGIVLMHVYGWQTLRALETLLPQYQELGYTFVTVSELILDADEAYIDPYGSQRPLHHDEAMFPDSFLNALRQGEG